MASIETRVAALGTNVSLVDAALNSPGPRIDVLQPTVSTLSAKLDDISAKLDQVLELLRHPGPSQVH
jgi:hypothetical protein